jgi:hypothetical protein
MARSDRESRYPEAIVSSDREQTFTFGKVAI